MFAGTRDKCLACKNTVYPTEKVKVVGHLNPFAQFLNDIHKLRRFISILYLLREMFRNWTSVKQVSVNGTSYHKNCFKCTHGGCVISPSNYIAHEGRLYCKHHHVQLIKEKGNLSQLEGENAKNSESYVG